MLGPTAAAALAPEPAGAAARPLAPEPYLKGFWAGLALAGILLAGLIAHVDTRALGEALATAEILPIVLALALTVSAMLLKAWRWRVAIEASAGLRPRGVVPASLVGFAANLVMPARLGEVARVLVLSRRAPIARALTLTSAGVGQLLDLVTLVLLMGLLALWGATAGLVEAPLVALAVAMPVLILAFLIGIYAHQERLAPLVEAAGRRLPERLGGRLVGLFGNATRALGVLHDRRVLAVMVACTVVVWALETVVIGAALRAFGVSVGTGTVVLLMTTLNLTFLLPLTPGNLGTHQLVSVLVLGNVGVEGARAIAFSIGLQGSVLVLTLALGLVCLYREGMDVSSLRRVGSRELAATGAGPTRSGPGESPDGSRVEL